MCAQYKHMRAHVSSRSHLTVRSHVRHHVRVAHSEDVTPAELVAQALEAHGRNVHLLARTLAENNGGTVASWRRTIYRLLDGETISEAKAAGVAAELGLPSERLTRTEVERTTRSRLVKLEDRVAVPEAARATSPPRADAPSGLLADVGEEQERRQPEEGGEHAGEAA